MTARRKSFVVLRADGFIVSYWPTLSDAQRVATDLCAAHRGSLTFTARAL